MLGDGDRCSLGDALAEIDGERESEREAEGLRNGDDVYGEDCDGLGEKLGEIQQSRSASSGRLLNVPQHTVPSLL